MGAKIRKVFHPYLPNYSFICMREKNIKGMATIAMRSRTSKDY